MMTKSWQFWVLLASILFVSLALAACKKDQEEPRAVGEGIVVTAVPRNTICHATGSEALPYVEIAISDDALARHQEHADDLIPAPAEGCPQAAAEQGAASSASGSGSDNSTPPPTARASTPIEGCAAGDQTVADYLQFDDRLSEFEALLNETGWLSELDGNFVVTVFAPTDDAFNRIEDENLNDMLGDDGGRNALVLYHMVDGGWDSDELDDLFVLEMLSGELLRIDVQGDQLILNQDTHVVEPDVTLCNGIVHVIDDVLVPPIFDDRPDVTPTPESTQTPQPTPTRRPTDTPRAETSTPRPTRTPLPAQPSPTAQPTRTPLPDPTDAPAPTNTPQPEPTDAPDPTSTPEEGDTGGDTGATPDGTTTGTTNGGDDGGTTDGATATTDGGGDDDSGSTDG